MLISTTDVLQGIEIEEYIKPICVSVEWGKSMAATKMLGETMDLLMKNLTDAAEKVGADAVIGLKFSTFQRVPYIAYGTAVKLK